MMLARLACGPGMCLLLAAAVPGCNRSDPTPLAALDETAVKEYQALLEKDIGIIEEEVGILKTIDAGAASRENAKLRLVELAAKKDKVDAEIRAFRFKDLSSKLAVRDEALARVAQRQKDAVALLLKEIRRINEDVPGGREFFQTDLRQTLDALKSK